MTSVIGVDGGGTHTGVGFGRDSLDELQRHRVDIPGRVARGEETDAAARISAAVTEAAAALGIESSGETLVVGAAGAGSTTVRQALHEALAGHFPDATVIVTTDADIAFVDAFEDRNGILLSAGTGSIAVGAAGGDTIRTGGHGWRFGDDGSGYWIGQEAVNSVLRAADGRGPETTLSIHLAHVDHTQLTTPADVAFLTDAVCRAASEDDDDVADMILDVAVDNLVWHVEALTNQLGEGLPVALNGGLFDTRLTIRDRVVAVLDEDVPCGPVLDVEVDPIRGAVKLGLSRAP